MKTVTIPLEVAKTIADMIPRGSLLKAQAVAHALVFMEAIALSEITPTTEKKFTPSKVFDRDDENDDGLGDRATR